MVRELVKLAAKFAAKKRDIRTFKLAAIGIRSDGRIVHASNGPTPYRNDQAHAEARLAKKLDVGSTVIVVRVRPDGRLAMAKPCKSCELILKSRGVRKVYFSTNSEVDELGSFNFS